MLSRRFTNSLQPKNQFLNQPLLTLEDIKNSWHADPRTCIKVSSADILQFAAFFATTGQKHTPEFILSTSTAPTAIAKRNTLKNDFLWGRPDESNCDVAWTDNLPGFATPANAACSGAIICRCTAAGDEINIKMIKRNGFTASKFQLFDSLVIVKIQLTLCFRLCSFSTSQRKRMLLLVPIPLDFFAILLDPVYR
jgi:hypothetical protein